MYQVYTSILASLIIDSRQNQLMHQPIVSTNRTLPLDPDELQMLDELDTAWVRKWKLAAARAELEVRIILSTECEKVVKRTRVFAQENIGNRT